jgi:hypothetical protein
MRQRKREWQYPINLKTEGKCPLQYCLRSSPHSLSIDTIVYHHSELSILFKSKATIKRRFGILPEFAVMKEITTVQ